MLAVAVWTVLHFSFLYALRDLSTPEIDVVTVPYCWMLQALLGPSARQAGLHVQRFADASSRR